MIRETERLLRDAGDLEGARLLKAQLDSMKGWFATKESLFTLGSLCHPKATLGERRPRMMTWKEWDSHLALLQASCARAFNVLERLSSRERRALDRPPS